MRDAIPETATFVTHLECSETGDHYRADSLHNLSEAKKPLLVRYDLDGLRAATRLLDDADLVRPHNVFFGPHPGF